MKRMQGEEHYLTVVSPGPRGWLAFLLKKMRGKTRIKLVWRWIMAKRIVLVIGLLMLVGGLGVPAYAWDSFGHMEVAYIAYQQLTPEKKARVDVLLRLNPDYSNWLMMIPADATADEIKMQAFMIAATWPDEIKSESQYTDDGTNGGNTPATTGTASGQNTGYRDLLRHKYWHFIDTPISSDAFKGPDAPAINIQERIALFRSVLASASDDTLKSYDLAWLLHLVGDVHQPLHCTTRFSTTLPGGDAGGNKVKLKCSGCALHLHTYWDDVLGSGATPQAEMDSVIRAGKKLPKADATQAAKADEKDWVAESVQEAQDTVYQAPVVAGIGPFSLTTAYKTAAKNLAKQRIALAGARLANLINANLK